MLNYWSQHCYWRSELAGEVVNGQDWRLPSQRECSQGELNVAIRLSLLSIAGCWLMALVPINLSAGLHYLRSPFIPPSRVYQRFVLRLAQNEHDHPSLLADVYSFLRSLFRHAEDIKRKSKPRSVLKNTSPLTVWPDAVEMLPPSG